VILNLDDKINYKKMMIAKATKELVKNCETVLLKTGKITGKFREPQLEKLLGDETETIVIEHGIKYKFDALKIMFAKGNINERRRYADLIKKGEVIFDFYTGIGYFTLNIAKFSDVLCIYAFELNPISYKYLLENLKLNKIPEEKVIPILGDCRVEALKVDKKADRILMGILPSPKSSLDTAFKILNEKSGVIHYEGILKEDNPPEKLLNEVIEVAEQHNRSIKLKHIEKIKSYGPYIDHVCLDIDIK
jgi:tRNA wybutosine-synthesizing protein 2